eukprot:GHVS01042356.1.p1 GENE.GHVS01042356.1~~GHVS01042356.1.p1  ORF type:complete len:909 (-),score=238.25 GHVS01042356.1:148-2874(-)
MAATTNLPSASPGNGSGGFNDRYSSPPLSSIHTNNTPITGSGSSGRRSSSGSVVYSGGDTNNNNNSTGDTTGVVVSRRVVPVCHNNRKDSSDSGCGTIAATNKSYTSSTYNSTTSSSGHNSHHDTNNNSNSGGVCVVDQKCSELPAVATQSRVSPPRRTISLQTTKPSTGKTSVQSSYHHPSTTTPPSSSSLATTLLLPPSLPNASVLYPLSVFSDIPSSSDSGGVIVSRLSSRSRAPLSPSRTMVPPTTTTAPLFFPSSSLPDLLAINNNNNSPSSTTRPPRPSVADVLPHFGRRSLVITQLWMLGFLFACLLSGSLLNTVQFKTLTSKHLTRIQNSSLAILQQQQQHSTTTTDHNTIPSLLVPPSPPSCPLPPVESPFSFFAIKGSKSPASLFDSNSSILSCPHHHASQLVAQQLRHIARYYILNNNTWFFSNNKTAGGDTKPAGNLLLTSGDSHQSSFERRTGEADVAAVLLSRDKSRNFDYPITFEQFIIPHLAHNLSPLLVDKQQYSRQQQHHLQHHRANHTTSCPNSFFSVLHSNTTLPLTPSLVRSSLQSHSLALRYLTCGLLHRVVSQQQQQRSAPSSSSSFSLLPSWDLSSYVSCPRHPPPTSSYSSPPSSSPTHIPPTSATDLLPLLPHLNLLFHPGGFISPCYPFHGVLHYALVGWYGLLPYVLLGIGWIPSLFSTHPLTVVHAPRLLLYLSLAFYRLVVLYIGGNFLEYFFRLPYDFSDHVVLYMFFLLVFSLEWVAVARTHHAYSLWIVIVRGYYLTLLTPTLYMAFYTSLFFHNTVETWLGFFVGFLGIFCFFWVLVFWNKISLTSIGITRRKRNEGGNIPRSSSSSLLMSSGSLSGGSATTTAADASALHPTVEPEGEGGGLVELSTWSVLGSRFWGDGAGGLWRSWRRVRRR